VSGVWCLSCGLGRAFWRPGYCVACRHKAEAGWEALARIGHVVATGHALATAYRSGVVVSVTPLDAYRAIDAAVWGLKGGER
jgi:hypothetical protein